MIMMTKYLIMIMRIPYNNEDMILENNVDKTLHNTDEKILDDNDNKSIDIYE